MGSPADSVALRIVVERKKSKLSQAVLAERLGVHPSAVSHWETTGKGGREPTVTNLIAIARAIGCDPAALLPGTLLQHDLTRMRADLKIATAECEAALKCLREASRVTRADLDREFTL